MNAQTYRITIQLTEAEYLALTRIAYKELRDIRWQAVHMLKSQLTTPTNPAPQVQVNEITAQGVRAW